MSLYRNMVQEKYKGQIKPVNEGRESPSGSERSGSRRTGGPRKGGKQASWEDEEEDVDVGAGSRRQPAEKDGFDSLGRVERMSGKRNPSDRARLEDELDQLDQMDAPVGGRSSPGKGGRSSPGQVKLRAPGSDEAPSSSKKQSRQASRTPGAPPGFDSGGKSIADEIEVSQNSQAQQNALAKHLLKSQKIFEKNAEDRMTAFIDRHGFTWYHVLMVLIVNNIIIIVLGISVSSGVMTASFSPLGEIRSDGLHAVQAGQQNVMVESVHGPSALTVRAAGGGTAGKPLDARVILEEGEDGADGMVISSYGYLESGPGRPLRLRPAANQDLLFEATGLGMVKTKGNMDVGGGLAVHKSFIAANAMHVDNLTRAVTVGGLDGHNGSLAVRGPISATGDFELPNADSKLLIRGQAQLWGGADVRGNMDLTGLFKVFPYGSPESGRRQLSDTNPYDYVAQIDSNGDLYAAGDLAIGGTARLTNLGVNATAIFRADVRVGDDSGDTFGVNSISSFHEDVTIGDGPGHRLLVDSLAYFSAKVQADEDVSMMHDVTIGNESHHLDVHTTATLRNEVQLKANVFIGDSLDDTVRVRADLVLGHCDPVTNPCNNAAGEDEKVHMDAQTGNVATVGTLSITGLSTLQVLNVQQQATFDDDVTVGTDATDALTVESTTQINAAVTVADSAPAVDLHVVGAALINGRFETTAVTALTRDVSVGTTLLDTFSVRSVGNFDEDVLIKKNLVVGLLSTEYTLTVRSDTVWENHLQTAMVTLEHTSGNIVTEGTLAVQGLTTLQTLTVEQPAQFDANILLGSDSIDQLTVEATTRFNSPVTIGDSVSDIISLMGASTFYQDATFITDIAAQGDVMIGDSSFDSLYVNSEAIFVTEVEARGNFKLGDDPTDQIKLYGAFAVMDGMNTMVTINPTTGNLLTEGTLTVEGASSFNAGVVLGSFPSDAIQFRGVASFQTDVNLGDDAVDSIVVNGNTLFVAPVVIGAAASFTVVGGITLGATDGSSVLTIEAPVTVQRTMNVQGDLTLEGSVATVYSNVDLKNTGTLSTMLSMNAGTGNFVTLGSATVDSASISTTLDVTGASTLTGGAVLGDASGLTVTPTTVHGETQLNGGLTVATTATVVGAATFQDSVLASGSLTATGAITLGTSGGAATVVLASTATFNGDVGMDGNCVIGDSTGDDLIKLNGRLMVEHLEVPILSAIPTQINDFYSVGSHLRRGVSVHGILDVEGDPSDPTANALTTTTIAVSGAATFNGEVHLGRSAGGSPTTVNVGGNLVVGADATFGVDPSVAPAGFTTAINIHSAATLTSTLEVLGDTSIGPPVDGHLTTLTVNSVANLASDLNVEGSVRLGSRAEDILRAYGRLRLYDISDVQTMELSGPHGSLAASGDISFLGTATFGDDDTDMLSFTGGGFTVTAAAASAPTFGVDPLLETVDMRAAATISGQTVIESNLFVQNGPGGGNMFEVFSATGNMNVMGDLEVTGEIITRDQPLRLDTLYANVILGGNNESGVTIEGVQFLNGGFKVARADVIDELTNGHGLFIEGVKHQNGAVVLDSHNPGVDPRGETDLMTIINSGHAWDMDGSITTMLWKQYFHNSDGVHHVDADAAKMKVGTETDWTEASITHDAYISFETIWHGGLYERIRMASDGDITFTESRFRFEADNGDTDIEGHVQIGQVPGNRFLKIISTDDDASVQIHSPGGVQKTGRLSVMGDYTEAVFVSAEAEDARIMMLDSLADGYAWTRTGAGNELTLDRISRGDGSSVSVSMGSADVTAMFANDFRDIRPGDQIYINVGSCVNGLVTECTFGETESREVLSIDLFSGGTGTLTVDSPFSDTAALIERPYYVSRRVSTVVDDNTMVFGGTTGDKVYTVQSSDATALLKVMAAGARKEAAVDISGDDDGEFGIIAGPDKVARVQLEEFNGDGYAMWRTGAANKLQLFRTFKADGNVRIDAGLNVIQLAAGGTGVFEFEAGDYIIVDVDGVDELRLVESIDTGTTPDSAQLDTAFDATTTIEISPYKVARPVMTVTDEDNMFFGGTTGDKMVTVKSADAAADLVIESVGVANEAVVTLRSGDNAAVEVRAGANDDARLLLIDEFNQQGYTIARKGQFNVLAFDNVIASPLTPGGAPDAITVLRGEVLVTSSGELFGSLNPGDHIIVQWNSVEYTREIVSVDVTASPDELNIDMRFSDAEDYVAIGYMVGRRVVEFESKDDVVIGGNSGAKTLRYGSTDSSALLAITATGVGNEGLLTLTSGDAAELSLSGGSDKDVRLLMSDAATKQGYELSRTTVDNDFNLHRIMGGPGGTIDVVAGSTTVNAASAGAFLPASGVAVGDKIVAMVENVKQTRTIMSIAGSGTSLVVDAEFHATVDVAAEPFTVNRQILNVDMTDVVTIGGSAADKTFNVESTDENSVLNVIAIAQDRIAAVNVQGDVALVDINSGQDMHTKMKMRDRDSGLGYLLSRGGSDGNALTIQKTTAELTRTISSLANSDLVRALEDGQFAEVFPNDRITVIMGGVETTRTVLEVNRLVTPDRLTVDATFHATEALEHAAGQYVVERPILTLSDEDTITLGSSTGSKAFSLQSTDQASSFVITANCQRSSPSAPDCMSASARYESRMSVVSEYRSSLVVQSGLDEDAVLHLVSTTPGANGFAFTRMTTSNQLVIDRTTEGPGNRISCTAASMTVVATNDGDFDYVAIGDRLVVMIDGIESSAIVVSLDLVAEPDELDINVPFSADTTLTSHPYMVYSTVITVVDDHTILMGGNKGAKQFKVESTDDTAHVVVQASGAMKDAKLELVSTDYTNMYLKAGSDKDARFYLQDEQGTGFMIRKAQGTSNALTGTPMAASTNALTFERTVPLTSGAARVDALGNSNKLIASTNGDFANIRNGDYITVIFDGVEIQRKVIALTLIAEPDQLDVDSPYSTDNIVAADYFVSRPLVAFNDYHSMIIGDTMSPAQTWIKSSHDSATLTIEAHDSPIGQADSTGQFGHAELRVESDSISTVSAYSGTGEDARLKLKDLLSGSTPGFMWTRMYHDVGNVNKMINFRTQLGPGNVIRCDQGTVLVRSGSSINAFDTIEPGDYLMTQVDGIEVIREVDSVDRATSVHTLNVVTPFSAVTDIDLEPFEHLRPVISLIDSNTYLFGGTSGDKTYTIQSTDQGATLSLMAAGLNNRAQILIDGGDTVDVDLKGGTTTDIRLKLRDDEKGFVYTRNGADDTLTLDHWSPGPGGTLSAGANVATAVSQSAGDFAGLTPGDRLVVVVDGNEATRTITTVSTGGGGADSCDLDSPFSTTTALAAVAFYVSRRTMSIGDDANPASATYRTTTIALAGTSGAKAMTLVSLDDRVDLTFTANSAHKPAMLTLESVDDMAVLQVQGGANEDAKLKLSDRASRNGYAMTRGDGANNELQLDRMYPGGGTISVAAAALTVFSNTNLYFGALNEGDFVSLVVDGVEEIRTIMSIRTDTNPHQLEVSSMFSGTTVVTALEYQIARRVMTVESDDVVIFGGCRGCVNSGDKELVLSSTDSKSELTIEGLGSEAKLTLAAAEDSTVTIGAGTNGDAELGLKDRDTNRGFYFSRTDGANNVLQLDRSTNGPGATVTVGSSPSVGVAGSTLVHASADSVFATLVVGDRICIMIGTQEEERVVQSIDLTANPDTLVVDAAFSLSASLENEEYYVKRRVARFDDDNTMTLGGSAGDKTIAVTSIEGSATLALSAAGTDKPAVMTATSAVASSSLTLAAGSDKEARLKLSDGSFGYGYGYVLGRTTDAANADENVLALEWLQPGPGNTITVTGGSTTVTSDDGTGPFGDVLVGNTISVLHPTTGERITRRITTVTSTTVLEVASQFTAGGTDLSAVRFEHGKQVLTAKDDGTTLQVGGGFTEESPTSLTVSGDLEMAGLLKLRTTEIAAAATIAVSTTHLAVTSVPGSQGNLATVTDGSMRQPGTLIFVENRDDNDVTGDLDCPGLSKCIFVCSPYQLSGQYIYEKYAQVDFY